MRAGRHYCLVVVLTSTIVSAHQRGELVLAAPRNRGANTKGDSEHSYSPDMPEPARGHKGAAHASIMPTLCLDLVPRA